MKTHYSKVVDAGVDPYSKPYKGVDYEAWVYMIDHVWLDDDYQVKFPNLKNHVVISI